MFELPTGEPVDAEMELGVSRESFPFDFGCVTYYKPRAKNPVAHRLVCAGVASGWLCANDKGRKYTAGAEAEELLKKLDDSTDLRVRGTIWTQAQFEQVARDLLEAFTDPASLGTLLPMPRIEGHVPTKDLALLVEMLASSEVAHGACAIEDGMLIHAEGELPTGGDEFATIVEGHLSAMEALGGGIDQPRPLASSIALENGSLLLAPAGDAAIAVWTRPEADHTAMLANAAALLRSESAGLLGDEGAEPLPEGVEVKDSRGGIDQMISHLRIAKDESVTGYLESVPMEGEPVSITLVGGIPAGIRAKGADSTEGAITRATSSSNRLRLVRLDRTMRLLLRSSTVDDFSLAGLCETIATCRTRSDDRKNLLQGRLETLFGFELGVEGMQEGRKVWKLVETEDAVGALPGTTRKSLMGPVVAELQVRIQRLQEDVMRTSREKSKAEDEVVATRAERDEVKSEAGALQEMLEQGRDDRLDLSKQLDDHTLRIREEQASAEEQAARSERLARRVSELEHQIKSRAEELAGALGEMESRTQLLEALEGLLSEEGRAKAELEAAEARLAEVRRLSDDDERLQRVLHEQVNAQRERHRRAQADLNELERRVEQRRDEMTSLEGEAHSSRANLEEERLRCAEMDRKHTLLQSELRELMEERRQLMRELGDLDTRRGSAEAELRMLVEQSEDLQDAHELALVDIAEAERIRARLSEEPLARALLGDETGLAQLEPVLDRMSAARSRGFSVVLLDRAVERGLQIIQHTVDEVAKTPRYLLSTEVMDLLSRQAPETADTVRSLTRWSVQNRLENRLSETVSHVVLDLENILNEYEQSVTMLMQLREVIRQMVELGLPSEQVGPLEKISHMPEALPSVSREVNRLIRQSLDDIYLESDRSTSGEAVGLEQTVEVLEKLMARLEASGLTGETPPGILWTFQQSGMLPFESHALTHLERPAINNEAISHMNAAGDEVATSLSDSSETPTATVAVDTPVVAEVQPSDTSQTWEPIDAPSDRDGIDLTSRVTSGLPSPEVLGTAAELSDLAKLEMNLAEMDSSADTRDGTVSGVPPPADPEKRSELDSLEDELSDLDL